MASNSEARRSLLGDMKSVRPPMSKYGTAASDTPDAIHESIRLQDEAIGQLADGASNVRDIAVQIHGEVDSQLKVLDGITESVDNASHRVVSSTAAVDSSRGSVYSFKTFCILLWPLVVLMILIIEAILHFLF